VLMALMLGVAFCCSGAAMLYAWSLWPLLPLTIAMVMTIPLFCRGVMDDTSDDMPGFLADNNEVIHGWTDLKWFIFGILLMSSMLCSWLLGRSGALSMPMAWVSSVGAWSASGVICVSGALNLRAKLVNARRKT